MTNLSLTYSFWWIFFCIIIGGVYAWIQYTKKAPWSNQLNYGLAGLRWLLVSLLCFLLLEPYLNTIQNQIQKPLFIIAVDNSTSTVLSSSKLKSEVKLALTQIEAKLTSQGYDVSVVGLEGNTIGKIDSLKFNRNTTDLSSQLNSIKRNYDNFNVGGMVLFTDGIFNQGYSPLAISTQYPIYPIGIGDTSKIKDLAVVKVVHNATVFEGNSLMLEIHSLNTGFKNVFTELKIRSGGKLLSNKKVVFNPNQLLDKTIISIPITGSGKQSLTIELIPIKGEFTTLNNVQAIYFDVIDAQKKILILASSPHPDIKAIKTSIEKSEYYSVELAYKLPKILDYDLIIAHQYPSTKTSNQDKKEFINSAVAKWMIIGGSNDVRFLQANLPFTISGSGFNKFDLVKPIVNAGFDNFKMSDGFLSWASDLPPITTPYGLNYNDPLAKVFLNQQIGSVTTEKPLLFFTKNNETNLGVLLGTNSWKWKLDEYQLNQSHQYYDELISKTVQYLSADQRKKRFYVAPQKAVYEKGEDVLFNTQEYNALFEQITGNKVELELKGENGYIEKFSYVPLSPNSVFKISSLQEGVYSYNAKTTIEDKMYSSKGQFVVKSLNLELLNPIADFDLLQKMALKSNGEFYSFANISVFNNKIKELEPVSTIHSTQKDEPLLNFKWIFGLLLIIASAEWFLRKFYGGY